MESLIDLDNCCKEIEEKGIMVKLMVCEFI